MNLSTVIQPGGPDPPPNPTYGYGNTSWGLVSLDWSVNAFEWLRAQCCGKSLWVGGLQKVRDPIEACDGNSPIWGADVPSTPDCTWCQPDLDPSKGGGGWQNNSFSSLCAPGNVPGAGNGTMLDGTPNSGHCMYTTGTFGYIKDPEVAAKSCTVSHPGNITLEATMLTTAKRLKLASIPVNATKVFICVLPSLLHFSAHVPIWPTVFLLFLSHVNVFADHNGIKALAMFESFQPAMGYGAGGTANPDYKPDCFLQYTDGNGKKNGTIFVNAPRWPPHHSFGLPGLHVRLYWADHANPGSFKNGRGYAGPQYYLDLRTNACKEWWIRAVMKPVMNPWVDGTFIDEINGGLEPWIGAREAAWMKITHEVAAIQQAHQRAAGELIYRLVQEGKYAWQGFTAGDKLTTSIIPDYNTNGQQVYESRCNPLNPVFTNISWNATQLSTTPNGKPRGRGDVDGFAVYTVASFLLLRNRFAWLGTGWLGGSVADNIPHKYLDIDPGEPMGECYKASGSLSKNQSSCEGACVYRRNFTKGYAQIACNVSGSEVCVGTLSFS